MPYFYTCGCLCMYGGSLTEPGGVCVSVVNYRCYHIEFTIVDYVIGTRLTAIACLPYTTRSGTLARSYRTDRVRFSVKFSGGDVEI